MEFKPNKNDVLDAFKLRILTDDNYVLECLQKVGLDISKLSRSAVKIILKDFRRFFEPLIRTDDYDVTDTFKNFVNAHGNYSRTVNYLEIGNLILVPNDDGTFAVMTSRPIGTHTRIEKGFYSSAGIEMRRESYFKDFDSVDITTRNPDLVTFTSQRIDNKNKEVEPEKTFFVDPQVREGRTLYIGSGYTRLTEGFSKEEKTPEEIKALTEYLQLITGLSPLIYTKDGEYNTSKNREDSDSLEEALTPVTEEVDDGVEL